MNNVISSVKADKLSVYKTKQKIKKALNLILKYVFLLAFGYLILYPLFYMISVSFRSAETFFDPSITWITFNLTEEFAKTALDVLSYGKTLWNTISYEVVSALLEVISCSVAAYGLARFDFKGKKIYEAMLFITILVPVQITVLPQMVNYAHFDILGILGLFNKLTGIDLRPNLLDTHLAFWLPSICGVGLRSGILIYIYRQFFKGLPKELEEAAAIDGANSLTTYIRVAVPSSGVVIFTVLIFSLIWHWNDYYLSATYLTKNFPLAVSVSRIAESLQVRGIYWGTGSPEATAIVMAGCLFFVLPMLIFYMIIQRKFVKSIDRVGITG